MAQQQSHQTRVKSKKRSGRAWPLAASAKGGGSISNKRNVASSMPQRAANAAQQNSSSAGAKSRVWHRGSNNKHINAAASARMAHQSWRILTRRK